MNKACQLGPDASLTRSCFYSIFVSICHLCLVFTGIRFFFFPQTPVARFHITAVRRVSVAADRFALPRGTDATDPLRPTHGPRGPRAVVGGAHLPFQLHWSLEYWQQEIRQRRSRGSREASAGLGAFISPLTLPPPERNCEKVRRRASSYMAFPWGPPPPPPSEFPVASS